MEEEWLGFFYDCVLIDECMLKHMCIKRSEKVAFDNGNIRWLGQNLKTQLDWFLGSSLRCCDIKVGVVFSICHCWPQSLQLLMHFFQIVVA